jgi:hypothetical protein
MLTGACIHACATGCAFHGMRLTAYPAIGGPIQPPTNIGADEGG